MHPIRKCFCMVDSHQGKILISNNLEKDHYLLDDVYLGDDERLSNHPLNV